MMCPLLNSHDNTDNRVQPAMHAAVKVAGSGGTVGIAERIPMYMNIGVGGRAGCASAASAG